MDFYITLPSNVKNYLFDNTVANYQTKLASRLQLDREWEVGLSSISYTKSWLNFPRDEDLYVTCYYKGEPYEIGPLYIKKQKLESIEQLIKLLNDTLEGNDYITLNESSKKIELPQFELVFDDDKNKVLKIKFGADEDVFTYPKMSENLCSILSIDKVKYDKECLDIAVNKLETKSFDSDILSIGDKFCSIFVYCDIVKPMHVGDSITQLLRFVEIPRSSNYGDQVFLNYTNIQYIPVMTKEFDTIEIDLRDDVGFPIPFNFGRTICVLHFRPKVIKVQSK